MSCAELAFTRVTGKGLRQALATSLNVALTSLPVPRSLRRLMNRNLNYPKLGVQHDLETSIQSAKLDGIYRPGVKLTKAQFAPIAERLQRSQSVGKWSVVISRKFGCDVAVQASQPRPPPNTTA